MGTGSFPGVKRPGRGVDHPLSSSARVKERVELYLYSRSGPSWRVLGRTLPLPKWFLQKSRKTKIKVRWLDCIENDLKSIGVKRWRKKAEDRSV
jgi:hypothetical protein